MRKVSNYLDQQRQDTSKELRHFHKHHDKDLKECYNQVQHRLECMVYPQQGLHALPIREREPMPIIYSFATSKGPPSHPGSSEAMRLAVEENEETLPGPRKPSSLAEWLGTTRKVAIKKEDPVIYLRMNRKIQRRARIR